MARKRGNGEGSIYKKPSGLWCAQTIVGHDENGKPKRRTIYGKTQAEVRDKLEELKGHKKNGLLVDIDNIKLREYMTRWLKDSAKKTLKESTYALYEQIIRSHINPHLGDLLLQKLAPLHVRGMLSAMEENGCSERVQLRAYAVLHRALNNAVKDNLLPRNPATSVDRPRPRQKAMKVLSPAQMHKLMETAKEDRLYALYVIACTAGLRLGELAALRWEDIDLKSGSLHVRHNMLEVKGRHILAEPKTAKGRRKVRLTDIAVSALRDHRKTMLSEGHHASEFVFCNSVGGPLRRSHVSRRSFKPLLKKAELPDIRFHDLRHSTATLLLSQNVHAKIVSEMLGHSQISVTLDVYSHVLPDMQEEAVGKLNDLFSAL